MDTKKFNAEVKADAGTTGEFEAVVAVFDNVDRVGDRIKSSAFDASLKSWQASGDPIPIIFSHEHGDPFQHIGYANPADVKAVPGRGLVVKGTLDIADNPLAAQVHRLMKRRSLKEFSFGYSVPAGGMTKASDGAYDLNKLDLIEFGPTLKGVNDQTELLGVKSLLEKDEDGITMAKALADLKAQNETLEMQVAVLANAAGIEFKSEEPAAEEPAAEEPEAEEPAAEEPAAEEPEAEAEEPAAEESTEESDETEGEKARDLELEHFSIALSMHDSPATARDAGLAEFERQLDGKQSLAGQRKADTAAEREREANASAAAEIQAALERASQ